MKKRKSDSKPHRLAKSQTDLSLAQALRKKYQDVQNEKIPERLQELIEALKEAERREKQGN
ncbi:MAG: NepR family anti-sigma factor [Henriciella sp.]